MISALSVVELLMTLKTLTLQTFLNVFRYTVVLHLTITVSDRTTVSQYRHQGCYRVVFKQKNIGNTDTSTLLAILFI